MKPMTTKSVISIISLYQSGMQVADIAREVHYSEKTIYSLLTKHRDVCPKRCTPKPTEEQYDLLKSMWADGMSMRQMATEIGSKKGAIRNIVERHRDDFPRRRLR
jgi:DNA-binding NarL/FixJ family response regulator